MTERPAMDRASLDLPTRFDLDCVLDVDHIILEWYVLIFLIPIILIPPWFSFRSLSRPWNPNPPASTAHRPNPSCLLHLSLSFLS